jgi:two-component system response regulator DevR
LGSTARTEAIRRVRRLRTLLKSVQLAGGAAGKSGLSERFVEAAAAAFGAQIFEALTGRSSGRGSRRPHAHGPHGRAVAVAAGLPAVSRPPLRRRRAAAASEEAPVRLLIVERHTLTRMGLVRVFEREPGFVLVAAVATGAEALEAAGGVEPDVFILGAQLRDGNSSEVCQDLLGRCPQSKVLILCTEADQTDLTSHMGAGACGYVLEDEPPARLIETVRRAAHDSAVLSGGRAWPRRQAKHLVALNDPRAVLPDHQLRLLPLLARGRTNREIAVELGLSEHTVKTYVSQILRSLHFKRRSQAAVFATRLAAGM